MPKKTAKAAAKPPTKSEIMANIAETTGLTKKDVAGVFEALTSEISDAIGKRGGPGQFTIPGLCKIVVRAKPAQKPRLVRNPATGEMVMSKAKPASKTVRIRPLKAMKDMVA